MTMAMTEPGVRGGATRRFASPLSRTLARQAGLDLDSVSGSGPQGRIVKADVLAALESGAAPRADAETETPYQEIPNSFARKLAARRLTESKQRAPHFYVRIDCNIDPLLRLRDALSERALNEDVKLSVNDFVICAAASALKEVPAVNASFTEAAIRRYQHIHIALAVALDDGLVTPVLEHADRKGVAQIAREVKDLAARARAGTLGPGASSGGSFSISNLGSYGVREFAAVINPPQGAILAVGAAEPRAVVKDGQLAIATMMTVTLSVDHRVIDGVVAARWLEAFKRHVEHPQESDVWKSLLADAP